MLTKLIPLTFILVVALLAIANGDDPSCESDVAVEPLTPEAIAIESELRESLPPDSEAIAMLNSIMKGGTLGGEDGWFPLAKAQSRFDWDYLRQRYDSNADQEITRDEFSGSAAQYGRLDRDGDKKLSSADLDWSEHSLTSSPGFMMFFMADRDANGKVTREEFAALFDQVAGADDNFLALDELRNQFLPQPSNARDKRADRPSISTLVEGLKEQEIGSLQSGPNVGEVAPDFTLVDLQGNSVTLFKEVGDKPIVLIFGNFTCGPFRSQSGNIEKLYERYKDQAKFFLVYVREAHPSDGWWMLSNQRAGIELAQPQQEDERRVIAERCQTHLNLEMPFLVDGIDDHVGTIYSGMPNRLYVIDQEGKIVFKNGRGPFGFHPRQLEQALIIELQSKEK